jgi:outer membrane protein assembly factor BamA
VSRHSSRLARPTALLFLLTGAWCTLATSDAVAQAAAKEVVVEVRVRGNYRTPDEEVLRIAGITTGNPLSAGSEKAVAERLRRSGRFDAVEVRKRYRSLTDESQVAIIIFVTERPGVEKGGVMPGPMKRLRNAVMASPALEYTDGYGVTAGGRVTFADVLGKRGHVSVPLTVGSTRQAAIEIDKTLRSGPVHRLRGGAAIASRENPAYDLRDRRGEVSVDASRTIGRFVSLGARAAWADVAFGEVRDKMVSYGAALALDTRANPAFPRNAIFASASWDTVDPDSGPAVNRYTLDGRAYAGLPGSAVLALRVRSETADGPLPVYERRLLGGFSSLRGFRAGAFTGDSVASASMELRVPFHSPMQMAQTGLVLFGDAGAAYDHGARLRDAAAHYGFGAGWYVHAPLLHMEIDVAHGVDGGTRVHAVVGFKF